VDIGASLLEAVLASPDEDRPRLAYADWCDKNAQPERAEFIRAQIDLARLPSSDPRRLALLRRAEALLELHGPRWVAPLTAELGCPWGFWVFRRGFVELADFSIYERLPEGVEKILDRLEVTGLYEPVRGVGLCPQEPQHYDELAGCPLANWLAELRLDELYLGADQAPLQRLLTSPHLRGLRTLHISLNMYSPRPLSGHVLARMARSPALAGLTELQVDCPVEEQHPGDFLRTLGRSHALVSLARLRIIHHWLDALEGTPLARRLLDLDVNVDCGTGGPPALHAAFVRRLTKLFHRGQLRSLTLRGGEHLSAELRQELLAWFGAGTVDFAPWVWYDYQRFGPNSVLVKP
jgi:uncharacterized protein (TIGR02996 family)